MAPTLLKLINYNAIIWLGQEDDSVTLYLLEFMRFISAIKKLQLQINVLSVTQFSFSIYLLWLDHYSKLNFTCLYFRRWLWVLGDLEKGCRGQHR